MITARKSSERGQADHGWLQTFHTFSFADYHDPEHTSFRQLRVINEDWVAPTRGFAAHPHRDMEIVTYILEGELEHKDSMGTGSVIRRGDVQRMSAGSGVVHSEFNPSTEQPVHLWQIWLFPDQRGRRPEYEQKTFDDHTKLNQLRLIVSPDAAEGAIGIHQDVRVFASILEAGHQVQHEFVSGRHGWLQLASGRVTVNGVPLASGDGARISDEAALTIAANERAEFLLFDLN